MAKQIVFAILWLATAGIAFFAGTQFGDRAERATQPQRGAKRAHDYEVSGPQPTAASTGPDAAKHSPDRKTRALPKPDPYVEENLSVEGVETVEELSDLLMAYARRKLNQGPEGHKELFKTANQLMENRSLQGLLRDESQLVRLAYPWLRFGFDHDRQIIDMMETLYRTAAEHPEWFEGLDDDPLEAFTEGLAVLLPGAVDEERLEVFRGLVRAILEADPKSQPKAVQKNRNEFEDNLEMWGRPLPVEEMLAILADPSESDADKLVLIRRISAADLRGADVAGIVGRELERGNLGATHVLRNIELSGGDLVALDRAFIEGMTKSTDQWWTVGQYVRSTGRNSWTEIKPFIEDGLRRGGDATAKFAHSLTWLPARPPVEYVRAILESYDLPDATVKQLKAKYGIE